MLLIFINRFQQIDKKEYLEVIVSMRIWMSFLRLTGFKMTDMKVVPDGKVGYDFIILSMVKVNVSIPCFIHW